MTVVKAASERITITVPRDLYDRLQVVKDGINISRVCQEGLDMAVRHEEIKKLEGDDRMKALSEKLRVQKQHSEQRDKTNGLKYGKERAMTIDYEDFKLFERIADAVGSGAVVDDLQSVIDGILGDADREFDELFWDKGEAPRFVDLDSFLDGYLDGVNEVWNEVSKNL